MKEVLKESLTCILTEDEMAKLAAQLGHLHQDLEELKSTRKRLVELIELKSTAAVTGEEQRMVDCIWTPDYDLGFMRLIRQDTLQEVRSYVMTDDERQQLLFPSAEEPAEEETVEVATVEVEAVTEEPVAVMAEAEAAGDDSGAFINRRNSRKRK